MRLPIILLLCFHRIANAQVIEEPVLSSVEGPAELGSLHRAAASLETTLRVYRLALVEIVPAARRLQSMGPSPTTGPHTPVPPAVNEVLGRMADQVPDRVPASELPVVARGYHNEVIDALAELASASELGEVREPLLNLTRGVSGVARSAEGIADLFSRQRPITVEIVDPEAMLADVAQALDEVAVAERQIVALRKRKASFGEQFQAFVRLEVTLGHALDLIAVAEEAGLHIGFEVQLSSTQFNEVLAQVRRRSEELAQIADSMRAEPVGITGTLEAVMMRAQGVSAELNWQPPVGKPKVTAVRIYRETPVDAIRDDLAASYRCEGHAEERATALAERATASLSREPVLVSEEAPGKSQFVEDWQELPMAAPVYRVVPVSAFGVEGEGVRASAHFLPEKVTGPSVVEAHSVAPPPSDASFYQRFDAVEVVWRLSPSDIADNVLLRTLATEHRLPHIDRYRVLRISADVQPTNVGSVPAGEHRFVDRLSLDDLRAGVRYTVEAVTSEGEAIAPNDACAISGVVQADLSEALQLGRRGLHRVEHPTSFERAEAARLGDTGERKSVAAELARFAPKENEDQLLESWWGSLSVADRRSWLDRWPSAYNKKDRTSWLSRPPRHFAERDLDRVGASVWLGQQPEEVQREVDRWWVLLDERSHLDAVKEYRRRLNSEHQQVLEARHAGDDSFWNQLEAVRVVAWLKGKDEQERELLASWWEGLDEDARAGMVAGWYQGVDEAERLALHWPDWGALEADEQQQRLRAPSAPLPKKLEAAFLAWLRWHQLAEKGGEAFHDVVAGEVALPVRLLLALRYSMRPLDQALGWRLPQVTVVLLLVVVATGLWMRRRRRTANR